MGEVSQARHNLGAPNVAIRFRELWPQLLTKSKLAYIRLNRQPAFV